LSVRSTVCYAKVTPNSKTKGAKNYTWYKRSPQLEKKSKLLDVENLPELIWLA